MRRLAAICPAGMDEEDRMIVPPDDDLDFGPGAVERPPSEAGDLVPSRANSAQGDISNFSGYYPSAHD